MDVADIPKFAILSGLFGTAASVFGKCLSHSDEFIRNIPIDITDQEVIWSWIFKIACIILMVQCNVFVWKFFVKALHQRGGSIVATTTSTATNYCASALVGNLIFNEEISALWWVGTSFITVGLVLVSLEGSDEDDSKNVDKPKQN